MCLLHVRHQLMSMASIARRVRRWGAGNKGYGGRGGERATADWAGVDLYKASEREGTLSTRCDRIWEV